MRIEPAVELAISLGDVRQAADRLRGVANRTPVATSRTLDGMLGAQVFFKCETLQRGVPATVAMPSDAPALKLAATREYGAEVVTYDRLTEDRESIAQQLAQERGLTLVPPYDHPLIMAGQGTAALELIEDAGPLDWLLAPVGGGGLLAGGGNAATGPPPPHHRRGGGGGT